MINLFVKKKITENNLSNVIVNTLTKLVSDGFSDVCDLLNTDPEFEEQPNISPDDYDKFLVTVITGNLNIIGKHFSAIQADRIKKLVIDKFASLYNLDYDQFKNHIDSYESFLSRVNHPSKNIIYGMSKTLFYKYDLISYQTGYFKDLNVPNPIILNRLNSVVQNFIWDWNSFHEKYKVVE